MAFAIQTCVGPVNRVSDGGPDARWKGHFRGDVQVRCKVWRWECGLLGVAMAEWLASPTAGERTQVRITPRPVAFITTAAAIYSLGHGLRTFTEVSSSTQPSTLSGTVK